MQAPAATPVVTTEHAQQPCSSDQEEAALAAALSTIGWRWLGQTRCGCLACLILHHKRGDK